MRVIKLGKVLILVIILSLAVTATAFADDLTEEQLTWLENNITKASESGIVSKWAWMSNYLTTDSTNTDDPTPIITKDGQGLYMIKGKSSDELASAINTAIKGDNITADVQDITAGLNLGANTTGAAQMLAGFQPILSLVLGVIVTLVTMGMTLFSAFDIAYIAFPVFRNKCEDAKTKNGGKIRWITDDAQAAVSDSTLQSGKSPWTVYFGKRIISYIMLAIVLFILLTGNISLITNIALRIVSGIMNVLTGLA